MLRHLQISNLAVIERLELDFRNGMTVLTGETGAGKSILIDALGLVLGNRADTSVVRTDARRTEVVATFGITPNSEAAQILAQQAIELQDDEILIRRVVQRDGGSRAYINTGAVSVQLLRELGEHLIDIHGQQASHSLFKPVNLLTLLDHYGGYGDKVAAVRETYNTWHDNSKQLQDLSGDASEFSAQVSLLEYQIAELEQLELQEQEMQQLETEHKRLSHTGKLLETSRKALTDLQEGDASMHNRLTGILRELSELQQHDAVLGGVNEMLDQALIQIGEAAAELRRYLDGLEQDPEQLQKVEQRIDLLHDVARKHHIHPNQLTAHFQTLSEQLRTLQDNRNRVSELEQQQAETLKQYKTLAEQLHTVRQQRAKKMAAEITRQLHSLGMPDSRFSIEVSKLADLQPHRNGISQVDFCLSANPGQALQPIRKIASGGELSRISLAIQVVAKQDKPTACMIFDEVDAGIGGGTAEIVGQLLHRLADECQILCVTHLPQVASQGDNHFLVNKQTDGRNTSTGVKQLSGTQRVEEIARMLGGVKISEKTRHHAMEMLGVQQG
ncbi:MAG: DNA repair protein RecN [Gammaproteobacteria bacterium]